MPKNAFREIGRRFLIIYSSSHKLYQPPILQTLNTERKIVIKCVGSIIQIERNRKQCLHQGGIALMVLCNFHGEVGDWLSKTGSRRMR